MRIFVLDTEYLSWNKEESNKSLKKRPQNHPAEIIQLYLKEIYTKKKNKNEINLFVKPQHFKKYPYRISRVTNITKKFLDKYGKDFRQSYKKLTDFIPSKSLIISNGDECELIDYNIKINKLKKKQKIVMFINFYHLIKKKKLFNKHQKSKYISISAIKKILKIKLKNHNAKNDVNILIKCMNKLNINKLKIINHSKYFCKRKI